MNPLDAFLTELAVIMARYDVEIFADDQGRIQFEVVQE